MLRRRRGGENPAAFLCTYGARRSPGCELSLSREHVQGAFAWARYPVIIEVHAVRRERRRFDLAFRRRNAFRRAEGLRQ